MTDDTSPAAPTQKCPRDGCCRIAGFINQLKVKSGKKIGYIAYNTNKEWEEGHTHLESFNMAKTIIDNVLRHKKPKTKNLYLLHSHKRLSDDPRYIRFIDDIIAAKKNKDKRGYRNRTTLERRD